MTVSTEGSSSFRLTVSEGLRGDFETYVFDAADRRDAWVQVCYYLLLLSSKVILGVINMTTFFVGAVLILLSSSLLLALILTHMRHQCM